MLPSVDDLQLLFARLNCAHFGGAIPAHRIAYNGRFSSLAGRTTYRPPLIELSPRHFERHPEALRETLLHEMIHAWLFALGEPAGHTPRFKAKMRELGLTSIYHDLGRIRVPRQRAMRVLLRCDACGVELLRARRPSGTVSCARCSGRRFDRRYVMRVIVLAPPRLETRGGAPAGGGREAPGARR